MPLKLKLTLLSLLFCATSSYASWLDIAPVANWHHKTFFNRHKLTTEHFVVSVNDSGFELSFSYDQEGELWMSFALPDRSPLELAQVLPNYQIDKAPIRYFPNQQTIFADEFPLRWVKWRVGKSQQAQMLIEQLKRGRRLQISYTVFGGHQQQTSFSLVGSKKAISTFLR